MKALHIIKIGGKVIDSDTDLKRFLGQLASLSSPFILIHGGGQMATRLAEQMGIPQQLVEGRRITDESTLKVATMVYAGLINKQLVASLQAQGVDAIGLSGADMNCVSATLRQKGGIDYGFAGDLNPGSVNGQKFQALLEQGFIPVVCAITHDGKGQLLNTNADTLASSIASAMSPYYSVQLNYFFEKQGVLRDAGDERSIIPVLGKEEYLHLKNTGSIHSGMIPKLDNAFRAMQDGVSRVIIADAQALPHIIQNTTHHGTELSC